METQQTISNWGRETFGPSTALALACRMNVEVAELLQALVCLYPGQQHSPLATSIAANVQLAELINQLQNQAGWVAHPSSPEAIKECADVGIMLDQITDDLGANLDFEKTVKMGVNRKRKWGRAANGKVQHVPPEVLPGAGTKFDSERTVEFEDPVMSKDHGKTCPYIFPTDTPWKDPGSGLTMQDNLWYILSDSGSSYSPKGYASKEEALAATRTADFRTNYDADLPITEPPWDETTASWEPFGWEACNVVQALHIRKFWARNDPETFAACQP